MSAPLRRRRGFTLIEVVGAFFLTIVILVFVTGLFVENGRQREAATALLGEGLSAVSALDLIGADFAGAIFLKRGEEDDPEGHPWRVQGASPGDLGSRTTVGHADDIGVAHDQDRLLRAGAAQARDQVGAARFDGEQLCFDALLFEDGLQVLRDLRFVAGRVGSVHAQNGDEVGERFRLHGFPVDCLGGK